MCLKASYLVILLVLLSFWTHLRDILCSRFEHWNQKKKERMQKGQRRKKGMNAAALETQCRSIGRKTKTGSSFNVATLGKRQKYENWQNGGCCSIEYPMSQHAWFVERLKIQCRSIKQWMPRHWSLKLKKNKEFDFYQISFVQFN